MKKLIWIILVVLIAGAVILSIKSEDDISSEPIKIGFIIPLTGDGALYGEPLKNVAQIAINEINSDGGINGQMIEAIYEDGQCSGTNGATAAQKLVNIDQVEVVIGGVCSNETLSALPITESAKVLLISPSASTPDLSGKSAYFFRTYPNANEQGKLLAGLAYKENKTKVAFISEQDDFTLGTYNAFTAEFVALGGEVIKEEFAPGTKDFKTQLGKLRSQNPDVLFINPLNPGTGDVILGQLRIMGWKPQIIINDPITGDTTTLVKNKDVLEGAWTSEFIVDPTNEKFAHLISLYKTTYGVDVPYQSFAQTMYDAVFLIKDGIEKVGYDGEKLAEWSRGIKDWQGASGKITIDEKGDRVGGPIIETIKDGKVVKLEN